MPDVNVRKMKTKEIGVEHNLAEDKSQNSRAFKNVNLLYRVTHV